MYFVRSKIPLSNTQESKEYKFIIKLCHILLCNSIIYVNNTPKTKAQSVKCLSRNSHR